MTQRRADRKARMALVGCGRVSARYREVFADDLADEAELVAVADRVPAKMQPFVDGFGAQAVGDLDALIAAAPALGLDLVCVLTESGHHGEHALALLEAGLPVVVEKPVTLRPDAAQLLDRTARERGLICAVIKQNRYNPALRFLRGALDQGRVGTLRSAGIRVHWCRGQDYYDDPWHGRWALDGGVLAQQAIHHLDALQWLGGPIEAVCAFGAALGARLEAEDTAVGVVRFASGALGTIEATTAARPRDFEASLHLVGDRALAKVGGMALNELQTWAPVAPGDGDDTACERHSQAVPTGYGLGHGPYLRDVLACWREGRTDVPVGVGEGLKSLQLVHALYASMEQGGWVGLAEMPLSARLGVG